MNGSSGARALLEDLFAKAVAAAHPSTCLTRHLPAPPRDGRLILLAAGKAAGSMIEVAEHALSRRADVSRAPHQRHRGRAPRLRPADARDPDDRSRTSGPGCRRPRSRPRPRSRSPTGATATISCWC